MAVRGTFLGMGALVLITLFLIFVNLLAKRKVSEKPNAYEIGVRVIG